MQLAARTPANAAMSAATVDAMAGGGRFIAGLGVSGPQIVEGWYGQPWGRPYYRMKDYVAIMRKIFAREAPVTHDGKEISLPYKGEGASGLGKPLKSILHMNPTSRSISRPATRSTVKLTAEIADGWLPMGFVPGAMEEYRPWLEEGFRRAGNGKSLKQLRHPGVGACRGRERREGGAAAAEARGRALCRRHGPQDKNFHNDIMVRRGFGDAAKRIQELYLAKRKDEAIAAVPDEWVDLKSLVGPAAAHQAALSRVGGFRRDSLSVRSRQPEAIEVMAQAARLNDPSDRATQWRIKNPNATGVGDGCYPSSSRQPRSSTARWMRSRWFHQMPGGMPTLASRSAAWSATAPTADSRPAGRVGHSP